MPALEGAGAAPCCVQGVNPSWFKQELGEEASVELQTFPWAGGTDGAAGSCPSEAEDKNAPDPSIWGGIGVQ